ncbi:MAG: integration host factor subunit alpha [candidate division WS2 bacterium ADurb.Bin280]|uniref:Integration host factor subunit alpha n=1 Tax=candidate division WS2 bacterium ADurb.Bin280 TaxID=1852829 RepID=A0A1V5SDL0_9BACT|nr:MAG: integration host factor subunit alpha [candidate division WS2 bacterium ADurb.Bin280]
MTTIVKSQITARVGKKIGWTKTKTLRTMVALEEIICQELNKKERVKLQNFGTFYLVRQKSRSIIQVRSKQRRILLNNTIIKFRPSLKIRKNLTVSQSEDSQQEKNQPQEIQQKNLATQTEQEQASEVSIPIRRINTQEQPEKTQEYSQQAVNVRYENEKNQETKKPFQRVSKERAQQIIREKMVSLVKKNQNPQNTLTGRFLETSNGGKFFDLTLRNLEKNSSDSLNLYFDNQSNSCRMILGKNRLRPLQVPRRLIEEILINHLELEDFGLPQERFVKLHSNSKMERGWLLSVHSLPLEREVSVYVKIVKKI